MFIVDCYNIVSSVKDVVLIEAVIDMQVLIINATGNSTETISINRFHMIYETENIEEIENIWDDRDLESDEINIEFFVNTDHIKLIQCSRSQNG
jgi:hypothetical protein